MIAAGLLEGLQDLGAAGISCAVSESAARAHMGADLDLDAVPLRERGLEAFEILTSESQERMLAVVAPERLADVRAVCEKWGLASAVIATLVPGDTLTIRHDGEVVAQVSGVLARGRRAGVRPPAGARRRGRDGRRSGVHPVRGRPARGAGRRALVAERRQQAVDLRAVRLVRAGTDRRVCRLRRRRDPRPRHDEGAGAVRATARAGSATWTRTSGPRTPSRRPRATSRPPARKPLAITNCMNFGNPERPVVMWQFAEAIRGMRDACLAFDTPVTGGNVSFYNESGDSAIWPTPVIGMLGSAGGLPAARPDGVRARGVVDLRAGRDVRRAGRVGVRRRRARRDRRAPAGARPGARAGAPRPAARGRERRPAGRRARLRRRRPGGDARRAGRS